jgi:hypothetical protein
MTNQSYFHGFSPSLSRISVCRETTLPRRSRQHLGAFLLRLGIRLAALLDKSHPLMQDLSDHAARADERRPNSGLIAHPRQQTPEHSLKITTVLFTAACTAWFSARRRYLFPFAERLLWFSSALSSFPGQVPT